jgi:dipeptidyl aminopeptidase/acylaminoacyl peptidase
LTLFLVVVAVGYVFAARARAGSAASAVDVSIAPGERIAAVSTAPGSRGRVITVAAGDPGGPRRVSALSCTRLYAAGGTGLCLRPDGDLATYQLAVLTSDLRVAKELPLVGLPTRARVSADGRMVAWTVFVTGDSYNGGVFSTRAGILDTRTGNLVASLESFAVTLNGKPYHAVDENFWGVTFAAGDDIFYATMSTAGHRYLVRGSIGGQTVTTLRQNVECPSLSPDGTRIAFKQAIGGDPNKGWHLAVLTLATGAVTMLAETRSVDDQAAWLSNTAVAYGIPRGVGDSDVWTVPADGSGTPRIMIPHAASPAALNA